MPTNLQIKLIKSLQQKKARQENKQFVVEGYKMIKELIEFKSEYIHHIYTTEKILIEKHISHSKLEVVSSSDLERMSGMKTSPDAIAVVGFFKSESTIHQAPISLYLDSISDPGNMGTILRTAEWFGLQHIYCSYECVDIYNPKVVQSSMGSIFRVASISIRIDELARHFKKDQIFATTMRGESIYTIGVNSPMLILMGSESHGLSDKTRDYAGNTLSIPCHGAGESLNVSVATGIILAHFIGK